MAKYLVTGATGLLGGKVVKALLERVPADQVAVSVRDPHKAEELNRLGVDVRQGDYDDAASLDRAFAGTERLLLISSQGDNETRITQHKTAVDAAKRAGVRFIAYTSAPNANHSKLFLAEVHKATEEAIQATDIPYSLLRNNWYVENETDTIKSVLAGAPLLTFAGQGLVGWAPRQDYAEAAAAVLTSDAHDNTIYELGGKLATYDQFAAAISKATGTEVNVQHVDAAAYKTILTDAGLPEIAIHFMSLIQEAIGSGELAIESDDLSGLLGRPSTTLEDAVAEVIRDIR